MKRRRWFRFSLRTFFVLLTVFGVWLGVQVKWIRDRHQALGEKHYGRVFAGIPRQAPWSIRILGESGYALVRAHTDPACTDEDNKRIECELKRLYPEAEDVSAGPRPDGTLRSTHTLPLKSRTKRP